MEMIAAEERSNNADALLKAERVKLFQDTLNFREPKRVPTSLFFITWPFAYAGVRYEDYIDDPEKAAEYYVKAIQEIPFDLMARPGVNVPVKVYQALKSEKFFFAEDGVAICHKQVGDDYFDEEIYEKVAKNPNFVKNELYLKKSFPVFNGSKKEAMDSLRSAMLELKKYLAFNDCAGELIQNKGLVYILGEYFKAPMYDSSINTFFDTYRGIKNTSIDLRRRPEAVREACKAIVASKAFMFKTDVEEIKKDIGDSPLAFGMTAYHSEGGFLTPKQFDEFFFNDFKKYCTPYMEAGAKYFMMGEGTFINTIDRYRDLPKGSCFIMLDTDDPFEMSKKIGDWQTLCCGITQDKLKYGTRQECIDYAKKCIDTFAPGGGFIFMNNKGLIGASDVNIDNVRAVYEFVQDYRG